MADYMTPAAALFDFDGTVVDTEPQYSIFWARQGEKYHPEIPHFDRIIKGQTLGQIFDRHFQGQTVVQARITRELDEFEQQMTFDYICGTREYVEELRKRGVKTAIVTSSNDKKMSNAYRCIPELLTLFDLILTADMFNRSKPDPDCFLTAAAKLGCSPEECVVFEDSFHGLEAGKRAGMTVVGLATTNSAKDIAPLSDRVWCDFREAICDLIPAPVLQRKQETITHTHIY